MDPGWKSSDPGSGINIPDPQHCSIYDAHSLHSNAVHGAKRYGTGTSVNIFYKYTLSYQVPRYDNFV